MEYELNDQDRADLVTNFVKKYGLWLVLLVIVMVMGFGIHSYLQQRQAELNQNASIDYQAMITAAQHGATAEQTSQSANSLIKNYPTTIYAAFANLTLANIAIQESNLSQAESILSTALQNSSNTTLTPIIRLRLARVLIAENKIPEAISLLKRPPTGFEAPYALVMGDAELLQNNQAAARTSYLQAQQNNQGNPLLSQLITERLNSLGGNS